MSKIGHMPKFIAENHGYQISLTVPDLSLIIIFVCCDHHNQIAWSLVYLHSQDDNVIIFLVDDSRNNVAGKEIADQELMR